MSFILIIKEMFDMKEQDPTSPCQDGLQDYEIEEAGKVELKTARNISCEYCHCFGH